ncbi:MAG: Acyl-CoA dehydrogenase [Caulobacter sp.]|nr:Acyl-CoA dehydrogenase [Caulobacter sp.]
MNLLPNPEQVQILDAARSFLSAEAPVERLRPQHGQIGNHDARLWPELAELGFLGLGLAEAHGGVGLGLPEEILLYRELGRQLISPAILGLTLAALLAARSDDPALLNAIVSGEARIGLATPRGAVTLGPVSSGAFHLIEAREAAWAVAWTDDGAALFRTEDFGAAEDILCMDSHLTLERGRLEACEPAIWISAADGDLPRRAQVLIAAYATGLAEAARDMAADYAKIRQQFGKPIGSFQAVKHRCADMAILAEVAWCQTVFAAVMVQNGGPKATYHAGAAKLLATDAALKNAAQNIQVHGAFGFTADSDAHLYLKRAHVMDFLGGDLRSQKAALIGLAAAL